MSENVILNVKLEPTLQPLIVENLKETYHTNKARSDVSTWIFWSSGQATFFDIRIFDPNA